MGCQPQWLPPWGSWRATPSTERAMQAGDPQLKVPCSLNHSSSNSSFKVATPCQPQGPSDKTTVLKDGQVPHWGTELRRATDASQATTPLSYKLPSTIQVHCAMDQLLSVAEKQHSFCFVFKGLNKSTCSEHIFEQLLMPHCVFP